VKNRLIQIGADTRVELLLADDHEFRGIGAVSVGGIPLRSAGRPFVVRLDTPEGILYPRLEFVDAVAEENGAVRIQLRALGVPWERGEFLDDYVQPLHWIAPSLEPVVDELAILLSPRMLDLGGRMWRGFSYAFSFRGNERSIHRLLVHGTWELGGSITGNTVLHQGQVNPPVYRGAKETLFTTACLRTLDQHGRPQGYSFQFGPRGGLHQAFDFQFGPTGALLQFWPEFCAVSSLVESPAGSELLHILDEYRFPLSDGATTAAKWVLFTAGRLAEHEGRDLWWAAQEMVSGAARKRFGLAETLVQPEIGMRYATRVAQAGLRMSVCGEEVDSREVPYAVAERLLPRLAKQGIKRFFPEVMSESDVTVLGMKRKLDDGMHGDLHCCSVCATHRFLPAEFWGGMKAWRHMAQRARALGLEIGAWFAPHFSPRAPIFAEHPEYRMIDAAGQGSGGGYGFQTLVSADWNTGIYDWVLADFRRWQEEGGLDYVFTDSFSNLGLLQANYAAAMRTNHEPLGRFYADLQKLGIRALSFESLSLFGVARFGVADPRGGRLAQDRSFAGQNDFGWWICEEDMAFGVALFPQVRGRTDEELRQVLFRTMANRGYVCFDNLCGLDHELPDWWVGLNRVYAQALPHMRSRRLLPDRAGVVWEDGEVKTIWAYTELSVTPSAGTTAELLAGSGPSELTWHSVFRLEPNRVCRIRGAAAIGGSRRCAG